MKREWPYLFQERYLLLHFKHLTSVELYTHLSGTLGTKSASIREFFAKQTTTNSRKVILENLEEAYVVGGRDDVLPAGVILLLLDHFKESANALFLYVDVSIS
jgi:hypothetical protein